MSVLDKVRRWIDGESAELVLEEAARNAQVTPRSQSEEFIVKIARAVEEVMQRELVPLPQGTAIIPTEYMVFLSESDDKDWQGIKRRGLEQGLYHILAERAKEIAGKRKLETRSFVIELRIDGTLQVGDVRVQHSWDEESSNKTGILSRPKPVEPPAANVSRPVNEPMRPAQPPDFVNQQQSFRDPSVPVNLPPTVQRMNYPQASPSDDLEVMTHVQKRQVELYRLEVWRDGVRRNVVPILSNEIKIGRGSRSKPVDVILGGDPEISRHHLSIFRDGNGQYSLINYGRNAATLNGYELPIGQRNVVPAGVGIVVCSYLLRIQPQ